MCAAMIEGRSEDVAPSFSIAGCRLGVSFFWFISSNPKALSRICSISGWNFWRHTVGSSLTSAFWYNAGLLVRLRCVPVAVSQVNSSIPTHPPIPLTLIPPPASRGGRGRSKRKGNKYLPAQSMSDLSPAEGNAECNHPPRRSKAGGRLGIRALG